MIVEAGNIIVGFLEPLVVGGSGSNPFIDKLTGVVKPITKIDLDKDNKPIRKTFPVSCNVNAEDCLSNGRYKDLTPDSKIGCMVYLEDVSSKFAGRDGRKYNWINQYRLVSWINQKKLGVDSCNVTSNIITTIIELLPEFPFNSGVFQRGEIDVIAQDPKSFNPFSKYSYDEDRTQYLMYPYDYFSLQIEFRYQLDKSCFTPFQKQTEIPC